MQSNNPVFNRSEGFNGRGTTTATPTDPSQWHIDLNNQQAGYAPTTVGDRMTIDSVVQKTGMTLGLVVASAAVTWFLIGDMFDKDGFAQSGAVQKAFAFAMGGAIVGLVLSLVNSFKRVISPALVLAYAVAEGVFVGAFSKVVASYVNDTSIVAQAVVGTMVAFGATLAAYKFFNIRVTDKFRKVVTISIFAFFGATIINFVLSMTGVINNGGIRGFNTLGLVVSAIAVVLAVFMLIMDFDFVERGIESGLPERESWRAAFGLTVTLIWLYIEILRILAILRGQD
ncbi:MAG: Bax inhibitor-1/YccA family protein [Aeromicrobium erythreum]